MAQDKILAYLVRQRDGARELLAFASHDEPGFEVPRGSVEPGETLADAVRREVAEECGILTLHIVAKLGTTRWHDELQHFFLAKPLDPISNRFTHTVTGDGLDRGLRYRFQWLPLEGDLEKQLVQGCNRWVDALRQAARRYAAWTVESPQDS